MKHLFKYNDFINEAKKDAPKDEVAEVKKEVKKLLDEFFASTKKVEYSGDGIPTSVEFEVTKEDYGIKYDEQLKMDYSDAVLAKRSYEVSLKYVSKKKTGEKDNEVYTIKFDVVTKKVEPKDESPEGLKRGLKNLSDDQLEKKLKSKKISDSEKKEIEKILKSREEKSGSDDDDWYKEKED